MKEPKFWNKWSISISALPFGFVFIIMILLTFSPANETDFEANEWDGIFLILCSVLAVFVTAIILIINGIVHHQLKRKYLAQLEKEAED